MLSMPDSTDVAALPDGYPAYLGYVDGKFANVGALAKRFPHARLVGLTVTGRDPGASGIDCEPGNVNAAYTRVWVQRKLAADPGSRPVIYASVAGEPNYGMPYVLAALKRNGIARDQVRLLSAHYQWRSQDAADPVNRHICGPGTCGFIDVDMDGTQWTDVFTVPAPGGGLTVVDMSVLADGFFGQSWTEEIVQELPVVRPGDSGEAVRTVQGCLVARHRTTIAVDGAYGPFTEAAIKTLQLANRLADDGVVGPQTWPVLLGIA